MNDSSPLVSMRGAAEGCDEAVVQCVGTMGVVMRTEGGRGVVREGVLALNWWCGGVLYPLPRLGV